MKESNATAVNHSKSRNQPTRPNVIKFLAESLHVMYGNHANWLAAGPVIAASSPTLSASTLQTGANIGTLAIWNGIDGLFALASHIDIIAKNKAKNKALTRAQIASIAMSIVGISTAAGMLATTATKYIADLSQLSHLSQVMNQSAQVFFSLSSVVAMVMDIIEVSKCSKNKDTNKADYILAVANTVSSAVSTIAAFCTLAGFLPGPAGQVFNILGIVAHQLGAVSKTAISVARDFHHSEHAAVRKNPAAKKAHNISSGVMSGIQVTLQVASVITLIALVAAKVPGPVTLGIAIGMAILSIALYAVKKSLQRHAASKITPTGLATLAGKGKIIPGYGATSSEQDNDDRSAEHGIN